MLFLSSITLELVEKPKYLGVAFTSGRRRNKEIKASVVLRVPYRSVVTNRELSNTAKLSV